jgi:hypothetical protein
MPQHRPSDPDFPIIRQITVDASPHIFQKMSVPNLCMA